MDLFNKVKKLIHFDGSYTLCPAGSIYRNPKNPNPGDIDMIMIVPKISNILSTLDSKNSIIISRQGERMVAFRINLAPTGAKEEEWKKVDVWLSTQEEYPFFLLTFGSGMYVLRIRAVAKSRGFLLNRYGLFYRQSGRRVPGKFKTVADIQKAIGVTVRDIKTVNAPGKDKIPKKIKGGAVDVGD